MPQYMEWKGTALFESASLDSSGMLLQSPAHITVTRERSRPEEFSKGRLSADRGYDMSLSLTLENLFKCLGVYMM